jgi:general secretion pathway protein D/MSHA biogenesis protein MshL
VTKEVTVKKGIIISALSLVVPLAIGCGAPSKKSTEETKSVAPHKVVSSLPENVPVAAKKGNPKAEWNVDKKGFRTKPLELDVKEGRTYLPIGAEIVSKDAPVRLIDVIKRMADLQGLSVSWADDVDPDTVVNVHIRPEDNFWEALDNLLLQKDYFFEQKGDTIFIKFKETRRYHLVMPGLTEDFKTAVGGNLIGGASAEGRIKGETSVSANLSEPLDFWTNVEANLDTILESSSADDVGHFIIDRNIGVITFTAPRNTHDKVNAYIKELKRQIYRQVIIETKIVEVRLNDQSQLGVDWSNIVSVTTRGGNETMGGVATFGETYTTSAGAAAIQTVYPTHKFLNFIQLNTQSFSLAMEALKEYGATNVLSNPKLTIMNGHGASMAVGEDITYIDKVETTIDDDGNITFTITADSVLSGLGIAVMANIVDDDEVILYIVPVTSELIPAATGEDIEYRNFGLAQVGLPRVRLREVSTICRIKDGETLIIGGHIDKSEGDTTNSVPFLGDIPGLGWLFKNETKSVISRELVIFITPKIVAMAD